MYLLKDTVQAMPERAASVLNKLYIKQMNIQHNFVSMLHNSIFRTCVLLQKMTLKTHCQK